MCAGQYLTNEEKKIEEKDMWFTRRIITQNSTDRTCEYLGSFKVYRNFESYIKIWMRQFRF